MTIGGPGWPPFGGLVAPSLRPLGPMTIFLVQGKARCARIRSWSRQQLPPRRDSHAHAGCPLLPSRCVPPGSEPRGGNLFSSGAVWPRTLSVDPGPADFRKVAFFARFPSDRAYSRFQLADGLASIGRWRKIRGEAPSKPGFCRSTIRAESLPTPFGGLNGRCCSTGRYSQPRISRRGWA